jgi:hypothetical protein
VIFIDMCKIHHHGGKRGPSNNGQIGYGCAAGAKAASVSLATAYRMIEELRKGDLIKVRKKGVFRVKAGEGRATEWEITIYPIAGRFPIPWGDSRLHIKHWLIESAAYKGLSNQAKCILIELMRRHDGGNNGSISFGGPSGAHTGFSADITERALNELQRAGFIVQTAPAVPYRSRPRNWRLTMYGVHGKPATKEFMRSSNPVLAEKSFDGFIGADDSAQNVSVMRVSHSLAAPLPPTLSNEISSGSSELREIGADFDTRADETIDATDSRATEIHLETSPPAAGRLASLIPFAPHSEHVSTSPPEGTCKSGEAEISAQLLPDEPAGLFGGELPSMSSPLDQLRVDLRAVLSRRRGTQSRLADALRLSRSAFANALSGRERFTATAAAALRRWLDGQPVTGDWPPLPPATEEQDAA